MKAVEAKGKRKGQRSGAPVRHAEHSRSDRSAARPGSDRGVPPERLRTSGAAPSGPKPGAVLSLRERDRRCKQEWFLKFYAQSGRFTEACAQAHAGHQTVHRWLREDSSFRAACEQVERELDERGETARRAEEGPFLKRREKNREYKQERFLEYSSQALSFNAACEQAHVHPHTVHRWLREDSSFRAACEQVERELREKAEAARPPALEDLSQPPTDGVSAPESSEEAEAASLRGGKDLTPPKGVQWEAYQDSPERFFREALGWSPWARQVEIAEAVRDAMLGRGPRRVAVRSGNGVGKTALAARLMLWVARCWTRSVVIATAPTTRQVDQLLWREARAACRRASVPLGGRFYEGASRWEIGDDNFALGLSPDRTQPERFHGFHGERIVFIVDEASGVPPAHWEAIKGSALAGNAVVLAIGNPTRTSGEFYEAFHQRAELWRRLHISAFDVPNLAPLVDPEAAPPIPGLVTKKGVEEARIEWGEQSSLWQVRILGQFPSQSASGLLDLEWIEDATRAGREDAPVEPGALRVLHSGLTGSAPRAAPEHRSADTALGVDVARSGQDETVLCLMVGNRVEKLDAWRGQDTMKTAGAVKLCALDYPGISIAIDDGGVGGGVVDRLREMDIPVQAVKFGAAPQGPRRSHFKNRLAELYWQLREAMRERKIGIPSDPKLLAQLTRLDWEQESDARIRVYKQGLDGAGESPDRADALALAWEARQHRHREIGIWLPEPEANEASREEDGDDVPKGVWYVDRYAQHQRELQEAIERARLRRPA